MTTFSERLKNERLKKGFTQQYVADHISRGRITYTNWENGKREPSFTSLVGLSNVLEVSADYLLGLSEVKTIKTK
ncbi:MULTISPECIES: helix-turn-helix domain-containing protein [unclassified Lactococcus]|uniref:helix-turn-helix domain-containing protein n=1 Tax=unclassified Lactococcus TaxID=2643510 RepID=UPI0011C855BC|nr:MULTISPECIES: helix-turn-helix transcriptional regulator [unclassified Lactococcus]MQW22521.1 helix-turn-helix domain-containing protein [Lactococcus sp. dk101]TXK45545.1 helix-turn-helix transcriptional regulator [Lactococcus sp. dk310]TXK51395.1 helix-turn-helix transcriptional regulator [Lactococcus sp. dk322]